VLFPHHLAVANYEPTSLPSGESILYDIICNTWASTPMGSEAFSVWSTAGAASALLHTPRSEIDDMHSGLSSLTKTVSELRSEMDSLRQANDRLALRNRRLQEAVREQETAREWEAIDVVERHYRDLERHKNLCRSRSPRGGAAHGVEERRMYRHMADGDSDEEDYRHGGAVPVLPATRLGEVP